MLESSRVVNQGSVFRVSRFKTWSSFSLIIMIFFSDDVINP